jgi:hypothetical protein
MTFLKKLMLHGKLIRTTPLSADTNHLLPGRSSDKAQRLSQWFRAGKSAYVE